MRLVLDTNLIVSGAINPLGRPGTLLSLAFERKLVLCMTPHLASELRRVFEYTKIRRKLQGLQPYGREPSGLVDDLVAIAEQIPLETPSTSWVADDPDDNWVIQCAITARADAIVSGDRAVLALEEVGGIPIVSAATLLAVLQEVESHDEQ